MNSTGQILKHFRKNRFITQEKLSKGIVSRQTYSKIERGDIEPNFEILNALLKKLDYRLSDFAIEFEKLDRINTYFNIYQKGLSKNATEDEIKSLNKYIHKNYKQSKQQFYLYGLTKGRLEPVYPDIIPAFTEDDKQYFKKLIMKKQKYFSLYDLRLIGNFSAHLLSYEDLLILYNSLPDFLSIDYGDDIEIYHSEVHKIYNNFCDIAIFNDDINTAKEILRKHILFAESHKDFRFYLYTKINDLIIKFKESAEDEYLDKLKQILKTIRLLGDEQMVKSLEYQINILQTKDTYESIKAITHN